MSDLGLYFFCHELKNLILSHKKSIKSLDQPYDKEPFIHSVMKLCSIAGLNLTKEDLEEIYDEIDLAGP